MFVNSANSDFEGVASRRCDYREGRLKAKRSGLVNKCIFLAHLRDFVYGNIRCLFAKSLKIRFLPETEFALELNVMAIIIVFTPYNFCF